MSKQSEAKEKQGYNPKPTPATCATCVSFTSEQIGERGWGNQMYYKTKNMRCGIGHFAVKKTATCYSHEFVPLT